MPELATLRIFRPMQLSGIIFAMTIEMDGRDLARLPNGREWASDVAPGRHLLRVRYAPNRSNAPLELVLAPGDDVRLELRLSNNRLSLVRQGAAVTDRLSRLVEPLAVQVLGVAETHRSEEPIGTETRRINNSSGVGRMTRTIRVTKEWTRIVSLDLHESHGVSAGGQIGPNWLAVKSSIELNLERTYAVSTNHREEFAEEIGVEIEPGADVTVILTWKRIWQHGVAHVLTQGRQVNVPYRMAVGITFDQSIQ